MFSFYFSTMLREFITQDLYLGFLLICLILVCVTRQLFSTRFSEFISILWNNRYLKLYSRDHRRQIDIFNFLLLVNFVVSLGLFIYVSIPKFGLVLNLEWYILPLAFCILIVLSAFKILLDRFIAIIFDLQDFERIYRFQQSSYKNIIGLLLIPSIVLLLFSKIDAKIIVFATLGFIFLISFIGFIRFLRLYQNALIFNLFYFLLYLCALEIGPYIILSKVIRDYFG